MLSDDTLDLRHAHDPSVSRSHFVLLQDGGTFIGFGVSIVCFVGIGYYIAHVVSPAYIGW